MANTKRLLSLLLVCLMLIGMPLTVLAEGETPVASVTAGGATTEYSDLHSAIDAAEAASGEVTLKLLQSISGITTPYAIGAGSFTVDLNGCALSSSACTVLQVTGGVIKIDDLSSGNTGSLETSANSSQALQVSADVTVAGGSFVSSASGTYHSDAAVSVSAGAKLTVTDNATIRGVGNCNAINAGQDSVVNIAGGAVSGAPGVDTWYSKLTVSDGTVNSLYLYGGTSAVTGGTVSSSVYLVAPNTTLNISGGTVTNLNVQNGTLNMTGGTAQGRFAGVKASAGINQGETAALNITGGTVTATQGPAIHLADSAYASTATNTLNLGEATLSGTTAGVSAAVGTVKLSGIPSISASEGPAFQLAAENQLTVDTMLPANLSYTVRLGTADGTGTFGTVSSNGSAGTTNFRAYTPGLAAKLENTELILAVSDAPAASIDYLTGELTGLEANVTYTINGDAVQANADGRIAIDDSWYASEISIAKADSDEQLLHITARPGEPAVTAEAESEAGKKDGRITGVDGNMEYRKAGETTWTAVPESADSLTGLEPGSYEVRAKATTTSFAGEIATVTVSAGSVKVTGISLSAVDLTMRVGEIDSITAVATPANATNQTLLWEADDTSVVTVDQNGILTAVGAGTATITVSATDGSGVMTNALVTVTKKTLAADMFTFAPPVSDVYDGAPKEAEVNAGAAYRDVGAITVFYYDAQTGDLLQGAPVDAGTYQVKIDVAESDTYEAVSGLTDSAWTFTVEPASRQIPSGVTAVAETQQGKNDGMLQGVTAEMEYKAEGAEAYTPVSGDTVTGLAPGKYYVRYRGSKNYHPSETVEVTVGQGAPKPAEPTTPSTPTGPAAGGAPSTGDNASPILWIIIAAVSLLAGLVLLVLLLRPQKGGKYAAK